MSSHHYSSANPVVWLRKKVFKISKPMALQWGEWETWDEELKKNRPVAFFLTETLPEWLEWIPEHSVDYVNNVRYWINNYWHGSHRLNSNLAKGKWHEYEERLLHSMFDSFVDFIEVETASSHIAWSKDEDIKKYNIPWRHRHSWTEWIHQFRCPQAGIDHLRWEMTLDEPPDPPDPNWMSSDYQAVNAREKMALYTWWKIIRPARGDDWDDSGLRTFWDSMDAKYGDGDWLGLGSSKAKMTAAEQRQYRKFNKAKDDLEEQRHQEDEDMMIRLIKIRRNLWT
jgi:hypothetical protein